MTPRDDLAGARAASTRLLKHLDGLDPDILTGPSLLPGWSRAHVLAHLAGNARALGGRARRRGASPPISRAPSCGW